MIGAARALALLRQLHQSLSTRDQVRAMPHIGVIRILGKVNPRSKTRALSRTVPREGCMPFGVPRYAAVEGERVAIAWRDFCKAGQMPHADRP